MKLCPIDGCLSEKAVSASGHRYAWCRLHATQRSAERHQKAESLADKPSCACGCGSAVLRKGARFLSGHNHRGLPQTSIHRQRIGEARHRAALRAGPRSARMCRIEGCERTRTVSKSGWVYAWCLPHKRSYYNLHGSMRRERVAAVGPYVRLDPWPTVCQICHQPLAGAVHEDHEPPIAWLHRHPEYYGPLVLRPAHARCNIRRRAHPDWESQCA